MSEQEWAEEVKKQLEELLSEIGSAGQNVQSAYEWGFGKGTAEKELERAKQAVLDFIAQYFTVKEQE